MVPSFSQTENEKEEALKIKRQKNCDRQRKFRERMRNKKMLKNIKIEEQNNINCVIIENNTSSEIQLLNSCQTNNNQEIGEINMSNANNVIDESIDEHYIGAMDVVCCHCGAKHFAVEQVIRKKILLMIVVIMVKLN